MARGAYLPWGLLFVMNLTCVPTSCQSPFSISSAFQLISSAFQLLCCRTGPLVLDLAIWIMSHDHGRKSNGGRIAQHNLLLLSTVYFCVPGILLDETNHHPEAFGCAERVLSAWAAGERTAASLLSWSGN
ncbi:hypothetical protein OF83DRAFT_206873 [Amylostereum chailletii]|nr:hypothetical protein OF83DRAFT_206873 [Amylostereum chailletii]